MTKKPGAPLPPPQARTPRVPDWPLKQVIQVCHNILLTELGRKCSINEDKCWICKEVESALADPEKFVAESAPQEVPLEVINRWISQVENPDFGSVPSKKTLLELLGYVREEIAVSKTAAPQEAGARVVSRSLIESQIANEWIEICTGRETKSWSRECWLHYQLVKARLKLAERGVPLEETKNG